MRSLSEFLLIAVGVTVTPGPGTATILRVAARDGRGAAMSAIAGNCIGVLLWGVLSALGVSTLILASHVAFYTLRVGGALVLIVIGVGSLFGHGQRDTPARNPGRHRAGWQSGLLTSISNPKLAVFFVALFPQFLTRGSSVLPYALAMAGVIVALDVVWYSTLAFALVRASATLKPRIQQRMERFTGAVMVGLGLRLAVASR